MLSMLLPNILGVVAASTWAWLALARGFFWRGSENEEKPFTAEFAEDGRKAQRTAESSHANRGAPLPQEFAGRVVAVVPARNEAGGIGTGIPSLLAQSVSTTSRSPPSVIKP